VVTQRRNWRPDDLPWLVGLQAAASRMVVELLDAEDVAAAYAAAPETDAEFAASLVDRELGLIAGGASPARVAFEIAVIQGAWFALAQRAEIRELIEIPTSAPAQQFAEKTGMEP
jgi:hypothetical protein